MSLTLTIRLVNGEVFAGHSPVSFDQGGSIGRSDSCDLVLPDEDKVISRKHADISFSNGQYMLVDSSLAGTYVNSAKEPVNNANVVLEDGMVLRIGPYLIDVSLAQSDVASPLSSNPFADPVADPIPETPEADALLQPSIRSEPLTNTTDGSHSLLDEVTAPTQDPFQVAPDFTSQPNDLLDSPVETPPLTESQSLADENISSLNDSYIPPQPQPAADEIPEDFNFADLFDMEEGGDTGQTPIPPEQAPPADLSPAVEPESREPVVQPPVEAPPVAPSSHPSENHQHLLSRFLTGAGIASSSVDSADAEEKMERIGKMFRQFVESTVTVLRNRAEFKSMFRVSVTTIRSQDNNPLKFSVTTDEALTHLINDGQGGFKPSVESIDEGYTDLLNHQLAMQAGIQASLLEILQQFNPDMIEKQYEEGIVLQKKSKYWDKYKELYAQLSDTAVEDFFGDAFAEAYEKQMKQLKIIR